MRSLYLSLACAIALAVGLVPAAANAATTQPQAQAKALDALNITEGSGALVVFKLAQPLAAGTVITTAGRSGGPAAATTSASRSQAQRLRAAGVAVVRAPRVARVGDEPAWFFYEDRAPYQSYAHAGRVVLVGAQTGKVIVTKVLQWPPVIAGRLPAFLRSAAAYRDARYRAFDRPWTSTSSAPAAPATLPVPGSPLEAAAARKQAADALATERSCVVRVSDTLGDFYDAASVDQSRARIGVLFNALARLNPGFVSTRYRFATVRGGESLTSFIAKLVAKRGCKDLMLYVAGGGYVSRGQSVINVGTRVRRDGRIEQQTVTASALRAILRAHPGVTFKVMLDAPYSGGFGTALRDAPNLLVFLASASATQGSFTALPEVRDPRGQTGANNYNKAQLLEFSNRQLTGMYCFVDSPGEVAAGARAKADGTSKSFLAWMLARAFSLCSAGSVLATVQGAPKPVISQPGAGLGSPAVPVAPAAQTPAAPSTPAAQGTTPPPTSGPDTPTLLAPMVALTGGGLSYTENGPATVVDAGLTVTDADSTSLSGATVSIASGFATGQDVLELTGAAPAGITSSYDAASGTLTLTGAAPIASYQAALRDVAYRNTSDAPSAAARSIRFVVTDASAGTSAAVARDLTVSPVNDGPTADDDAYTVAAEATLTVAAGTGALANDGDGDGDTLTVDQVAGSAANVGTGYTTVGGATVTINADGSLTYDPNGQFDALGAGQSDTDTVTYRATDGGLNDAATITFTINGANDAPVAVDDGYSVGQSAVLTVPAPTGVLDNDTDGDGDTLAIDQVAGSAGNVATAYTTTGGAIATVNANGSLSYDPNGQFDDLGAAESATDTVTYRASDGHGGTDTATITFTINGANDAPVATDDAYSTNEDTPLTVNAATGVLANDTDTDGDGLTVDQVAGSAGNVATVVTTASSAHVTVNANGSLSYDPNGQFDDLGTGQQTTDTVTYRASDGGLDDTATITVTITGVNDAPVAVDDAYSTNEDTVLTVNAATGVLNNDTDPEGSTLTVDQVAGSAGNVGTVLTTTGGAHATINANGSLTYDPNGQFNDLGTGEQETDTVTYRTTDGSLNDTATITFTITGVNDAPTAVDDAYSTDEDTTLTVNAATGVVVNDTDPEGDTLTVDQVAGSGANVGNAFTSTGGATVTVNANGSLSYNPNGQFNSLTVGQQTTDTFTYRTSDGGLNGTATVTITITGVNDAPTAVDDSYSAVGNTTLVVGNAVPAGRAGKTLTGSVKSNDTDPDTAAGSLTITAGTSATTLGGSVTVDADGTFTYTPPTSTTNTSDTFTYSVGDGTSTDTGTVTITLASRVWYVDNTAAAGGTGRSSDPFDTLAEATAAGGANATIFVHQGSGTTGQNTGAVLAANERLIGAAGDLVVGGDTLYDGSNAQRPAIGNAAGVGVTLASGSTVQGLGISAAGGAAISGGAGVAGSTIADVTLSGNSGGLSLSGTSGTFAISDTTISTTGGTGLTASGAGTVNFTSAGTISVTSSGARALNIASTALSGTIDDVTVTASAAGGVALQNTTGSIALGGLSLATTGGTAFLADSVAGLSVPAGATANVSDSGGTAVAIRNSTAPSATFDTVSATGAGTTGIDVSGNGGGGTTTFSGATTTSTSTATGVSLANNTGHTIAFTAGNVGITTTSGRGFDATGGGTVTVQGSGSTITSTTGTPLRIANTTIGASDVTFRSISANGAANGIVLDTTGSSGGLKLTGTNTAGSGGTIQNTAGADGTTQGIGVYLNSTMVTSLKFLNLINNAGWAIRGTTVSDFSLDSSTISGTNGTNDGLDEASVAFTNLLGTSSITNTSVSGGIEDNLRISNTSGTANITLDGDTIGANSASLGGNGVLLETRQTASTTTTVNDTDFTSSREDLFQSIVTDTASNDITFSNNTLANGQASQVSGNTGALIQSSGNSSGANLTYRVTGNTVRGNDNGIFVQKGVGIATARGRIENNIIGVTGVTGSGANNGSGIVVESRGQGTHVSRIAGNTIRQYNQDGISTVNGEDGSADNGTVNVQLTVVNNTVTEPKRPQTLTGFRNEAADPAALVDECLDLQGNVMTGAGPFGSDIRVLFDFPQNTVRLPGYAGGSQDTNAARAYFAGRNTATTTVANAAGSGPGYVNGGAGCTQPPA